uniref:RING-type domain-containing protein n=1 Tax=Macaca nemestrina TaxID=9545 RepID=A0A2K6CUU0_MACNE
MQFLKEEILVYLNIVSPFELTRMTAQASPNTELDIGGAAGSNVDQEEIVDQRAVLIQKILDFDQAQHIKCFNSKFFLCHICFCEKLGSECMYFLEGRYVYCKACLKDYFELQIRDGQVQCLNYPEPKCPSMATPDQVKELVGPELFSTLDLMALVVYCPRSCCQLPVMQNPGCTMGICSSCSFAFCTLGKLTYPGVSLCKVTRVIQKALEEMESKEGLEKNSKKKLDECNKMTCTDCMQYFCWICMGSFSRADSYKHFIDPTSPCFNGLFHAMDVNGDIWEDGIED